ncbi:transcriptional regulator [Bifidobacterium pullorum subsp. gallinarum]|uniref:Transcriptional regulator n=1 Tax=Bifidobacterium pullorum subsp. gallinarum TaxID=78344 RepID=A0A087ARZ0_9BIFI|nr:MerR family transcriptional regulator [Bifidobacterium pullorum]KFI61540.1 transcriptional regulator [Bifidobacterium pullorum subsp. gallinarum]
MYTMKETCALVGMSYETLKFYCRSGLVPNLRRDERNRRIFDDRNIAWINSLNCLRACGMGIDEMRKYMELCLEGETTVPERQRILAEKRRILMQRMEEIQHSIDYIDAKQTFYGDVLSGRTRYFSNLIDTDTPTSEVPECLAATFHIKADG